MLWSRRRAAQAQAAAEGRPLCGLCRRNVPVGADGRCLLGHRVRQPDESVPVPAVGTQTTAGFDRVDAGASPDDTVALSWADELRSLGDDAGVPVLVGAAAPADAAAVLAEGALSSWEASAASWDDRAAGSQPAFERAEALDELLAWNEPAGAPSALDSGPATVLRRGADAGVAPAAPGDTRGEVTQPLGASATGPPSADDWASMSYAAFAAGAAGEESPVEAGARPLPESPLDGEAPAAADAHPLAQSPVDVDAPALTESPVEDTPAAVAAQVDAQLRRRTLQLGAACIALGGLLGTIGGAVLL